MSTSITIRYAAKAMIIQAGQILCLKKVGDIGTFYVLPGGGQNPGELLNATILRECREELGALVEVGRLRYVQEYVGDNHDFRSVHKGRHFVNFFFEVRLMEPPETHPLAPDEGQVGLVWLDISELSTLAFFPRVLAARLQKLSTQPEVDVDILNDFYLGESV